MSQRGPGSTTERRDSFPSNKVATPKVSEGLLFQPLTNHQNPVPSSQDPSYTPKYIWTPQVGQRRGSTSGQAIPATSSFPYKISTKDDSQKERIPFVPKDDIGHWSKPFVPREGPTPLPYKSEGQPYVPANCASLAQPFMPPSLQAQTKIDFIGGGAAHILPQNIVVPITSLPGMFPGLVLPPVEVPGSSIMCNFYSTRRPSVTSGAPGLLQSSWNNAPWAH
ncbi:hypothetical protein FRC03_000917 [Tulasnella sp. 419]|nr:hypothetical protein FRC03_000917 [Tulasnella sp. 419]